MTHVPLEISTRLERVSLGAASGHLEDWIALRELRVVPTEAATIPTFQVVVPVRGRSHPLLSLQPPPNNPDVPFKKMRLVPRGPYSGAGARQAICDELNALLPDAEQKGSGARDQMFKLLWRQFADREQFGRIAAVLDRMIVRVRQPQSG